MLPLGHITIAADGIGHNTNLTHAEQITMMTLWGFSARRSSWAAKCAIMTRSR